MLGVLLESRAAPQRRRGGTALSAAVHLAIGAAVVTGTARARPVAPDRPRAVTLRFDRPVVRTPVARTSPAAVMRTAAPSQFTIRHIVVPTLVPTTLPPIDLTTAAAGSDSIVLGGSSAAGRGLGSLFDAAPSTDDASSWRGNEVLMHVLSSAAPRYPEALRAASVEGRVVVRFTVDSTGRIDMRSVEVLSSTHDLFSRAVRDALPGFRFRPAQVGGRRVSALAEMPFEFAIRR